MAQFYPERTTLQESTEYVIRLLGTGAANPTKQEGEGVVVTRTGTGAYLIQWAENPFQFVGAFYAFINTTSLTAVGWSVGFGDYDAVNKRLAFTIGNAGDSAADLTSPMRLNLLVKFARTGY